MVSAEYRHSVIFISLIRDRDSLRFFSNCGCWFQSKHKKAGLARVFCFGFRAVWSPRPQPSKRPQSLVLPAFPGPSPVTFSRGAFCFGIHTVTFAHQRHASRSQNGAAANETARTNLSRRNQELPFLQRADGQNCAQFAAAGPSTQKSLTRNG